MLTLCAWFQRSVKFFLLGLLLTSLLPTDQPFAAVPKLIRYQGHAVDSNGVGLEGPYTLTFRLYNALTVGNKLWEETQTNVPFTKGQFSVVLGQVNPFTTIDWSQPLWISVQVNSDPELSPRQELTSVPAAMIAEGLAGVVHTKGNSVGVGTTTPSGNLHLVGNRMVIEGDVLVDANGSSFPDAGRQDGINGGAPLVPVEAADKLCTDSLSAPKNVRIDSACNTTGDGTVLLGSNNLGTIQVDSTWAFNDSNANGAYNDGEDLYIDRNPQREFSTGNMGIGTITPREDARLHVVQTKADDNDYGIIVDGGPSGEPTKLLFLHPTSVWALGAASDGAGGYQFMIRDEMKSAERLVIHSSGKVGIGTSNPQHLLDVEGYVQAQGYYTGDLIFQKDNQPLWRMYEDEKGLYLESLLTKNRYRLVMEPITTE